MKTEEKPTESTSYQENAEEEPQIFAANEIGNSPKFSRRNFLELAAASTAAATLVGCNSDNEEIPTPTSTPIHVPVAVVRVDQTNLRSGPGETEYTDITELKRFEILQVTARNSDNSWFRVESSTDTVGWVITDSVVFRFPIDTLPIAAVVKEPNAGLREGPGLEYDIIIALAAGTVLYLLARDESGDWYKAETEEKEEVGWVRKADLVAMNVNINGNIRTEVETVFETSLNAMPVSHDYPPRPTPPPPPPTPEPRPRPRTTYSYWYPN